MDFTEEISAFARKRKESRVEFRTSQFSFFLCTISSEFLGKFGTIWNYPGSRAGYHQG
jgi:hypothetical protein